jgi:hypothetical protein
MVMNALQSINDISDPCDAKHKTGPTRPGSVRAINAFRLSQTSIRLSPMGDNRNLHRLFFVINGVNDAVHANANAMQGD